MADVGCLLSNQVLRALSCEIIALLHKAFHETLPTTLNALLVELTKLSESKEVLVRAKAILIIRVPI